MQSTVQLSGLDTTTETIVRIARHGHRVELSADAHGRMEAARAVIDRAIKNGIKVYGLTTSVGAKTGIALSADKIVEFNRRLILTHNFGHGPVASKEVVRAMMAVLLSTMASGYLGVRPILAERLVEALNSDKEVKVHVWGSMGESDMSPISDLALALYGDVELAAGEALSLINSSALSLGTAALAIHDLTRLLNFSTLVSALSMEGYGANPAIFSPEAIASRPFVGLKVHGEKLRRYLSDSYILSAGGPRFLQDPLCFRSLPLVQGTSADSLNFANGQIGTELKSSQNNPIVSIDTDKLVSVANFDMVALSMALDVARLAFSPVVTSSTERLAKMADSFWSGLSIGLIEEDGVGLPGFNGLAQFHKSITSEARLLAAPVVTDLASSSHSNGNLDRMSMAGLAARRAAELAALCRSIFAGELLVAAQAVDFRKVERLGQTTKKLHAFVRRAVPYAGRGQRAPHISPLLELLDREQSEIDALMN